MVQSLPAVEAELVAPSWVNEAAQETEAVAPPEMTTIPEPDYSPVAEVARPYTPEPDYMGMESQEPAQMAAASEAPVEAPVEDNSWLQMFLSSGAPGAGVEAQPEAQASETTSAQAPSAPAWEWPGQVEPQRLRPPKIRLLQPLEPPPFAGAMPVHKRLIPCRICKLLRWKERPLPLNLMLPRSRNGCVSRCRRKHRASRYKHRRNNTLNTKRSRR